MNRWVVILLLYLGFVSACNSRLPQPILVLDRESLIPVTQTKISPQTDIYPPKSETNEYEDPVPLPYPVNTAGAEDSAFILPDGLTLYVWFTPDAKKPPEQQVVDGVTGIYVFQYKQNAWGAPERVLLQDAGKLALDGCEFVQGDEIWFCSAREGYTGLHWFKATYSNGTWRDWQEVDFDPGYEVGELHITQGGRELYYHSARAGGQGGLDIWSSQNIAGEWQQPVNLAVVNSSQDEGWPFITPDGSELWFTRLAGAPELYRSKRIDGQWQPPAKMFSNFAGEPSLDSEENVYFTHHFFKDGEMLEADIYVARKR